jgi:hypothetical protein
MTAALTVWRHIYDVLSAQLIDAKQIARNKLKLAMAVGDNRHYGQNLRL